MSRKTAHLPETKNGLHRTVPLTPLAVRTLERLLQDSEGEGYVFAVNANAVHQAWVRHINRAGLRDFRLHDLRHEAVSRFFELGLTSPEVALIPNTFIDGAGQEVSPIEKLRRWQDANRLEFVVRLYAMQNLAEAGGIHWSAVRRSYTRRKIWTRGIYNVWGFNEAECSYSIDGPIGALISKLHWTSEEFWRFWTDLEDIGLIEARTYVVESLDVDAGIVFPFDAAICEEVEEEAAALADAILMSTDAAKAMPVVTTAPSLRLRNVIVASSWLTFSDCAIAPKRP